MRLNNKVLLITGASSGLGESVAYAAAREQMQLVLVARRRDKLQKVADYCLTLGASRVIYCAIDLTCLESIDALVGELKSREMIPDILLNNAGRGYNGNFVTMNSDLGQSIIDLNIKSLIYLTHQLAAPMLEKDSAQIIFVGSLAGKVSSPQSAVYAASKAAVISFADALRLEFKDSPIEIMTVNLGPMSTDFFNDFDPEKEYLKRVSQWVLDPDIVAKTLISAMKRPVRELNRPCLLALGAQISRLFPRLSDFIINYFNAK